MKTRAGWSSVLILVLSSITLSFQVAVTAGGIATNPVGQYSVTPAALIGDPTVSISGAPAAAMPVALLADIDDQDDPSYRLYKEGYKLILDEKWTDARGKFSELISKYSKSKYCADAQYWMAYSLKYADKKKAIEAYKSFLKKYPSSNYYDDATADLGRLENPTLPGVPPPSRFIPPVRATGVTEPEIATAPTAFTLYEGAAREYAVAAAGRAPGWEDKQEDPQVRMKVEAFQALLRRNQDDKTFELLKQTLLDAKQPYRMKETALFGSKQFEKQDLVGLYLQALRSDTSTMLRRHLLYQLGTLADRGDERVLPVLTQTALDSKQDRQVREAALIGMRSVKGHDVLDLYVRIAKSDTDRRFREMALYQIGQAAKPDDEATCKTLKDIVLDNNQAREIRDAALHALWTVKGGKASDFYMEVAKSDPDERLQEIAFFFFVQANERPIEMLKAIILDRSRSWSMRQSAMTHLARIPGEEALNFLMQVAVTDPEERIRMSAISSITYLSKDKTKSLGTLISLFHKMPVGQLNSIQSLLYAIASIGNDEAVDFLGKVAKAHENYDVRRTAIQYLGNIGGEKARTILVEIMNGK